MKLIYKCCLVLLTFLGFAESVQAQQKIGSNLGTLNPGAVLELESSNRGFLPSRVALTASNVWSLNGTATNGMLVYNTATVTGGNALTPGYYIWQDGSWVRIVTGVISTTNNLTYTPGTRTITSSVNGVSSDAVLPLGTSTVAGLLSPSDWTNFDGKENVLTFANGLTRTANAIALGGALNQNTTLTLAANNFTFGGATTGKVIVSGPAGSSTSGLQLSNLLTAVTPTTAVANQRVLTVDANGNVILGTDFGTNNAGTVTNVTGTAPINVATGTTTPVISINALGITTGLLADGAVTTPKVADNAITTPKIADGAVTTAKITPGANGQYLTTVGGVTTWAALPTPAVTGATNGTSLVAGNVELGGALTKPTVITTTATNTLSFAGLTAKTVQVDNNDSLLVVNAQGRVQYLAVSNLPANNIYNADGSLTGNRTATLGANNLTFNASGAGQVIVSGPVGNTAGLRLSNLTGAGTAGTVGQKVLSVNASGDVVLVTDFGTNNAGTVTNVTGTAPINVATGTTTPVISINALGITTGLLADGAVTAAKLNQMGATSGQTLKWNGTVWAPAADENTNIYTNDGTLAGNRVVTQAGSTLAFTGTAVNAFSVDGPTFSVDAANNRVGVGTAAPTSSFQVNGSVANSILRITAATTLNETHHTIIANAFTAGYAITLPAPSAATGRVYVIRKVDESSNAITFTFTGITGSNAIRVSDSSASAGTYINSLNYTKTLRIQSDGTDWYLID